MTKRILVSVLFAGVLFTPVQAALAGQAEVDDAVAKAVAYLQGQGNEPTKTMALVAAGPPAGGVDVSYLKGFTGSTAIEYAKPIMAIAAAGENPATYPNEDFVAKLKSFANANQLGSVDQVNDDIWGILALRAAGVASSDSVIQNSKAFILANQNSDGGWAWNVGGDSDTNDTAGAITALLETGMAKSDSKIQSAISYVKSAQNDDGGFPYDPVSPFGTDSDGNSDAWIIALANKLGEDAKTWTKNGHNPVEHLLSLQDTDGGFWWMAPPASFNNKGPTADAVIALTGNSFPVSASNSGGGPAEVFFRIIGSAGLPGQGEVCRGGVAAPNAMDVVRNAASQCGYIYEIKDTSFGPYLFSINSDTAEGLTGWMYLVNDVMPEIGAADYTLSGGENVLWFYGEFGDEPPALGDVSDSVDLSVNIVGSGQGDDGSGGTPEVGFSANPSTLNFGQLVPGNSAQKQVTLKNEGQKNLNVEVEVQGDSVFNFLKLGGSLWNLFSVLLAAGTQEDITAELAIPAGFNSFGFKQGSLIFWGTAAE